MSTTRDGLERRSIYRSRSVSAGEFRDYELVPPSLSEIESILSVADDIEEKNPRVAYLCRAHAFQKACTLDPDSKGKGVRQFKTALFQKLQKEESETLMKRSESGDIKELFKFYNQNNEDHEQASAGPEEDRLEEDRFELRKMASMLIVIREVLLAADPDAMLMEELQITEASKNFNEKVTNTAYNILPLDEKSTIHLPEISAALNALRNTNNLSWLPDSDPSRHTGDILDWLENRFKFQEDNVSNQREHLVLLLTNMNTRLSEKSAVLEDRAVDKLLNALFENYMNWCKFLGHKSSLHSIKDNVQQRKLLHIGLYLLIWGEAANVRSMPECICYIFHNMASELQAMISTSGDALKPAYDGSFLDEVVKPIYNIIKKETENHRNGTASHSVWRNYDDLNEYFWSKDCFELNWPWNETNDFFQTHKISSSSNDIKVRSGWAGKMNFVELRSFWHIFRSFDRMWTFYILSLQVMIILAWSDIVHPNDIFQPSILEGISSIFITASILGLLQAVLNIILDHKTYRWMKLSDFRMPLLKLLLAVVWVVVLTTCYIYSWESSSGMVNMMNRWFGRTGKRPFLYVTAVIIYILPNFVGAIFFLFPFIKRWIQNSSWVLIRNLFLWSKPRLFVGKDMHEGTIAVFNYTAFWVFLLLCKLFFSYYVQIRPLVEVTRSIAGTTNIRYEWHEFFPHAKINIGATICIWVPVILVYFMDTQIWYAVLSSVLGAIIGVILRIGEIRTLRMLRARFASHGKVFGECLVPVDKVGEKFRFAKFTKLWNAVIRSFRAVDIISNRDLDLLLFPESKSDTIRWPLFLLASKLPIVLNMLKEKEFESKNQNQVWQRISTAEFTSDAVEECYELFIDFLNHLIAGEAEKSIVTTILDGVRESIREGKFTEQFNIGRISSLTEVIVKLTDPNLLASLLDPPRYELGAQAIPDITQEEQKNIVICLQNMVEITTKDIMVQEQCSGIIDLIHELQEKHFSITKELQLSSHPGREVQKVTEMLQQMMFTSPGAVDYSIFKSTDWKDKILRLHRLLTIKEAAMDVPSNPEAMRRITFFVNSLFMKMPKAPPVQTMVSFSVLTPYHIEDTIYTKERIFKDNEDGVSTLFYLQKIYPDEWKNFLERLGENEDPGLNELECWDGEKGLKLRYWASTRGQTLFRTVTGMMYYERALRMQAELDSSFDEVALEDPNGCRYLDHEKHKTSRLQALVNTKFTYIISCQDNDIVMKKRPGYQSTADILSLMVQYPSLRVAYVDEREIRGKEKEYYSVLKKAVNDCAEQIYQIKLPGPPILGEGKAENQNHAIIFTRGEALQAIDMNQDHYLEEALKMRNFLEEFTVKNNSRCPTILGMRENIFTGSVSSLGLFMSKQENTFFTIGQRVLARLLKTRFHYGHPDVFDRLFHITRGGICKGSRDINASESIFAGFNSILRQGSITHHEYIQIGKGRDVGLNQISRLDAKVANGNGNQAISRDIYRLGQCFDFFRMLACYNTTIGPYFNSMIVIITVYSFLYGRMYLALSGVESSIVTEADLKHNTSMEAALAFQTFVQLGGLIAVPMFFEIGLEGGFRELVANAVLLQLQLVSVFFSFSLGTKAHYFGRTILHGGVKDQPRDHSFVVKHVKFAENYRLYSRSHFIKGLEILILLVIYMIYGKESKGLMSYILLTFSIWFLVASWLFAPFVFNPSGFEWQKIVEDWDDWSLWIKRRGGIGVKPEKSWESWWIEEHRHLQDTNFMGRLWEVILAFRFLLYQYGLVYHLHIVRGDTHLKVYGLSWAIFVFILLCMKMMSYVRHTQLLYRMLKGLLFVGSISILGVLFSLLSFTIGDFFICLTAFSLTGWALLQLAQVCKPVVGLFMFWDSVKTLAQFYEYTIGCIVFAPVAVLAWFPFMSEFQSRLLFNLAFSRGLQISRILAGESKGSDD